MSSARYSYTASSPSDRPSTANPSLKRPHSSISKDATPPSSLPRHDSASPSAFYQSEPIHDRKSTFIGLFSPSLSPQDLQSHPSIASASHKILAWRLPPEAAPSSSAKRQQTLPASFKSATTTSSPPLTGQDDDGEQHAAKHLARLLATDNLTGSLVVARWYGGVMLGPVRFAHIEHVARDAIKAWRTATSAISPSTPASDESRTAEDQRERRALVFELRRRDESIVSLRRLLEDKKRILASLSGGTTREEGPDGAGGVASSATAPPASPVKKVDYEPHGLDRLRILDRARDGTVAFLLKQIDAVEDEVRRVEEMFDDDDDDDGDGETLGAGEGKEQCPST